MHRTNFPPSNSASIWGFQTDACYTRPVFALPAPLIRDARSVIGQLQGEFHDLHFGFLLCVGPGSASSLNEVAQHQINEHYIEQKAIRTRKGRPAPPAIPRDEIRAGPRNPHGGGRAGMRPQPKLNAGRGAMGGGGPKKLGGRRVVDSEGPYHKAEPLRPWGEAEEEEAQASNSMRRRKLQAPRAASGSGGRYQMNRRQS
mgnify:CR=1 FL=1